MRRIWIAMAVLATSGVARAAPTIDTNPFELAGGSIPSGGLPAGTYAVGGASCKLTPDAQGRIDVRSCAPLAGLVLEADLKQGNAVKATVRLSASARQAVLSYRPDEARRTITFFVPEGITGMAVLTASRGWVKADIDATQTSMDADVRSAIEQNRPVWIIARGEIQRVTMNVLVMGSGGAGGSGGSGGTAIAPGGDAPKAPRTVRPPAADWCQAPAGLQNHLLVCFVEQDGRLRIVKGPRSHIVAPNQATLVMVSHDPQYAVSIAMAGTVGLTQPGVVDFTIPKVRQESGGVAPPAAAGDEAIDPVISSQPFAPRQPGAANIHVEVKTTATPSAVIADQTLELIVEQGYLGAIRLGFGVVGDNAVDRSYAAHLAPGSTQLEIARTSSGKADVELVLGFSAFIWDGKNGRRYLGGRSAASYLLPAPFVGIGLVGDTPTGLTGLRSLYFGVEWEPVRSFSVALTGVGRRVTRLADGYAVGDAVSEGTSFTEQRFEFGVGVVFSVSPEFLRIAAGAAVRKE
jgi:hypothetical protein